MIFKDFDVIVKVKNMLEGIKTKTIKAVLKDYLENEAIVILAKENNMQYQVELDNIFSVRLDEDELINKNKGEDND